MLQQTLPGGQHHFTKSAKNIASSDLSRDYLDGITHILLTYEQASIIDWQKTTSTFNSCEIVSVSAIF